MLDLFNREISYLFISVNNRYSLHYKPHTFFSLSDQEEILTIEEIVGIIKTCITYSITNVRFTGGEPLLRKDIISIVKKVANINGINDFSITTDGLLLEEMADELYNAGLRHINVNLCSVDRNKYYKITGNEMLCKVFKGIEAAQRAGLYPIKINCEVLKDDPSFAIEVQKFASKKKLPVRFTQENGEFSMVSNGGICNICNRIKIMANGMVKPCLFSSLSFSIRELGIERAILKAILNKPLRGSFNKSKEL